MFVSGNELYGVIAALLLATPTVIWLGLRIYAMLAALIGCKRCRRLSDGERMERCPLSAGMLEELEKSGRNIRWALIGLLILLVVWWLIGTVSDQSIAVGAVSIGAVVCCVLILFAAVSRIVTSMRIPASFRCRKNVLESMRKNGRGFGWLLLAYIVVHILLTI